MLEELYKIMLIMTMMLSGYILLKALKEREEYDSWQFPMLVALLLEGLRKKW